MKDLFKILQFIILVPLLFSCNPKKDKVIETFKTEKEKSNAPNICEEYSSPLDIADKKDTLKILVEASDYGELGGHREYIYIQRNRDDKIIARFIKDTVPCNKRISGSIDDKARVIVLDTTKLLNLEEEKLMSVFLQRLLELYLKHEVHSNSGSTYKVNYTNKTLDFTYWNSGNCRDTYYGRVRKQIFGDILKIK
jgi:hypothetical protein